MLLRVGQRCRRQPVTTPWMSGASRAETAARIWHGAAPGRALLGELTRLGFDP
jgi:hypothetical protein